MTATGQPENDDWNRHWGTFGDAVSGNPATAYRSRLILKVLGKVESDAAILEIGCGQGEFTLLLAETYPQADVRGIDISAEGVERAVRTAHADSLSVHFAQRDLLQEAEARVTTIAAGPRWLFVRRSSNTSTSPMCCFATPPTTWHPGCRLVVTVPGGPRSAFDRHIGHRRHFTATRLRRLLEESGFEDIEVHRAGFPFFDLYRLVVIARGKRLIADVEQSKAHWTKAHRVQLFGSSTASFVTIWTRPRSDGSCWRWLDDRRIRRS